MTIENFHAKLQNKDEQSPLFATWRRVRDAGDELQVALQEELESGQGWPLWFGVNLRAQTV